MTCLAEAIQSCKDAGLKIYMVTGDHPSTSLVSIF